MPPRRKPKEPSSRAISDDPRQLALAYGLSRIYDWREFAQLAHAPEGPGYSKAVVDGHRKHFINSISRAPLFMDETGADVVIVCSQPGERIACRKNGDRYRVIFLPAHPEEFPHWLPST